MNGISGDRLECSPLTLSPHNLGRGRRNICPDGSDASYCLHTIYAGCFLHSDTLGLSIAPCEKCFCRLKNHTRQNRDGRNSKLRMLHVQVLVIL